jgi:hypothetical protein
MEAEIALLHGNKTWQLQVHLLRKKAINSKWISSYNTKLDGSLDSKIQSPISWQKDAHKNKV